MPSGHLAEETLIHHVFLPPKLPQEDDSDSHGLIFFDAVIGALSAFESLVNDQHATVAAVRNMVSAMKRVHDSTSNTIVEQELRRAFGEVVVQDGGCLPLQIRAQNAGVIVTRDNGELLIETFELSATNASVMQTKGRLRRCFPATAAAVSFSVATDPDFQAALSQTLSVMSHQAVRGMQPQTKKNRVMHDEERDSTNPDMVSQFLHGFLLGNGVSKEAHVICKNTRDDILWHDAKLPWRRSPLWLLLRVSLQMAFSRAAQRTKKTSLYKQFMVFFMSTILETSIKTAAKLDLWHAMNSKLCRRLVKLDLAIDIPVSSAVQKVLDETQAVMQKRWTAIERSRTQNVDLASLAQLDFEKDIGVELVELDAYIQAMAQRQTWASTTEFYPMSESISHNADELPCGLGQSTDSGTILQNLHGFENWVGSHLCTWTETHRGDLNACRDLCNLLKMYQSLATVQYAGNPESTSMLVLVAMELWIACDIVATNVCPLLRKYDPGVSKTPLQNLLLPLNTQMARLERVETYLDRRSQSTLSAAYIFRHTDADDCFAAKYFDKSPEHKDLSRRIVASADRSKASKLRELQTTKAEYERLMNLYRESDCEYYEHVYNRKYDLRETRHFEYCGRCSYLRQANELTIEVHEWPLPTDAIQVKTVVFELSLPVWFGYWRETTLFLLADILAARYSHKQNARYERHLLADPLLKSHRPHAEVVGSHRIGLLSQNKPHSGTHYKGKAISTALPGAVCLNNGLHYKYYDGKVRCFYTSLEPQDPVLHDCTYRLPSRTTMLQKYIFRPSWSANGQPPNGHVASQTECPEHMGLHEYGQLCSVPNSYVLQWMDIAVQIGFPHVDFREIETTLVFLQCIYQAGPATASNSLIRPSHQLLGDEGFGKVLLEALKQALQRIETNWEYTQALSVFIAVARRLLSLSSSSDVHKSCFDYLDHAAQVALKWTRILNAKANLAEGSHREELLSRSVESALVCASRFDIERVHLRAVLSASKAASQLILCSLVVHDGKNILTTSSDPHIRLLHDRHRRLLRDACELLTADNDALNDAVQRFWTAYQPGSVWKVATTANHWVTNCTAAAHQDKGLIVHLNLLNGELLVNGIPLGRLPSEYETSASYQLLFGSSTIEVMPSDHPGMSFSGKAEYQGHELHFGLSSPEQAMSRDFLLQAKSQTDGTNFELIPARLLEGHFPMSFVTECVHWYNLTTASLDFRPMQNPWDARDFNTWSLAKRGDTKWYLSHGAKEQCLIGVASDTALALNKLLGPIAEPPRIHAIWRASTSTLDVQIPTLRLAFSLDKGCSSLVSREFRGYSIDSDQSLGTLIGFSNKLVLRGRHDDERKLLLLDGQISHERHGTIGGIHTHVTVHRDSAKRWHAYTIDPYLKRLIDNGNVQSKILLAYLHALTSSCMADPFTQQTGTERSLAILNCASLRSFDQLTEGNIALLDLIGKLTPSRTYYPANQQVMQTVNWDRQLGYMAQHSRFRDTVDSIFDEAETKSHFAIGTEFSRPSFPAVDKFLLERESIRSSTCRIHGYGGEDHTTGYDVTYQSRDRSRDSERRTNAFVFADHIQAARTSLHWGPSPKKCLWSFISKRAPIVWGADHEVDMSMLRYDATIFDDHKDFLSENWAPLQRILGKRADVNKYALMLWLATFACAENSDKQVLLIIASFYTCRAFDSITAPSVNQFHVSHGREVTTEHLSQELESHFHVFESSPEYQLSPMDGENRNEFTIRRKLRFERKQENAVGKLAPLLVQQWPCSSPNIPASGASSDVTDYVDISKALPAIRGIFKTRYENWLLSEYLKVVQSAASRLRSRPIAIPQGQYSTGPSYREVKSCVSTSDLFSMSAPRLTCNISPLTLECGDAQKRTRAIERLENLVTGMANDAASRYETKYISRLDASLESLSQMEAQSIGSLPSQHILVSHLRLCELQVQETYRSLVNALSPKSAGHSYLRVVAQTPHWPRCCPSLFLTRLSRHNWKSLSLEWKCCIVTYAVSLTWLQRARRLVHASIDDKTDDVQTELRNVGHRNWDPMEHPEWLLLEVESGIMIRVVQKEIADEMMDPKGHRNTSLQLNMGEGKSSVIAPMVASSLADSTRLVRIIVGKPQMKQMAHMLKAKLGGMLDRRIYCLPISRSLRIDRAMALTIDRICRECMSHGGILLFQPEHLLSFELMSIERHILDDRSVGRLLLGTKSLFDSSSRDVVDESDENFSVKFELVYTMGMQRCIDMGPERWLCIQQVLNLVNGIAPVVAARFPRSLEIHESRVTDTGRFPIIKIFDSDAELLLVELVGQNICSTGLAGFPISRKPRAVREAVYKYITKTEITREDIDIIEESGDDGIWSESTRPVLLLLRGLLAGGVLGFVFGRKRWRISYGLDSSRLPNTRLGVPYRAKDMPSLRSEFSHPDVVIFLTTLCYYYGGLNDDHLFAAFGHLLESDQKIVEYQTWVKSASNLKLEYHQLDGINLKDHGQCITEIFPALRQNKCVIDYFLSHIVFPKEMKEFPQKLSASGWDLGKRKHHPTTAFSGTSDSQGLLPLDITHLDLPDQQHTNALVLDYLLQPENSVCYLPTLMDRSISDAEHLLATVINLQPAPRVILDVGAQILELTNAEVAQKWLQMYHDESVRAVVFLDDNDELVVMDHEGHIEALQTSPFADQLDACLVYLDEAHTRGTDLRLPRDYRAVVTLGANLTKDRLVQACMRMRKLGKGQTVVFCVSTEIRTKIERRCDKEPGEDVIIEDILKWSFGETFADIHRNMPLWAAQGQRFLRQEAYWNDSQGEGEIDMTKEEASRFLEDDAQDLETRYRPHADHESRLPLQPGPTDTARLAGIVERCNEFDSLDYLGRTLQEEQERELSPEIEQERQIQRPPAARAAQHKLHADIAKFVTTGVIVRESKAYMPAFQSLKGISAAGAFDVSQLASDGHLLVTADFARTVQQDRASDKTDSYLRSVQYILTTASPKDNTVDYLMIISPYEAHELFTKIQQSKVVVLHIYKPRLNLGYKPLDHLNFFTIPQTPSPRVIGARLKAQLNVFAGQIYFNSRLDYLATCEVLGLAAEETPAGWIVAADGFVLKDDAGRVGRSSGLKKSPIPFLKHLFRNRRYGEDIGKSHMGMVLNGMLLDGSEFA